MFIQNATRSTVLLINKPVARFGAALWARVGRSLSSEDLDWSRSFGREDAPQLLLDSLIQFGAVTGEPPTLSAAPLSRLLYAISFPEPVSTTATQNPSAQLIWTLPDSVALAIPSRRRTYLDSCVCLIDECLEKLLIVSPYLDARGVGFLFTSLLNAMGRGVQVMIITHDVLNAASLSATALEELRREAVRIRGNLVVYSADAGSGPDRREHPLLHAKLFVADETKVMIGSANLTSYALSSNLEAGAVLGPVAATEVLTVLRAIIDSGIVYPVFSTKE